VKVLSNEIMNCKMTIQVKLFGNLVDVTGTANMQLKNIADTDSLLRKMFSDFPQLAGHTFIVAVERKISTENQVLNEGDVVAFLPPFAGG